MADQRGHEREPGEEPNRLHRKICPIDRHDDTPVSWSESAGVTSYQIGTVQGDGIGAACVSTAHKLNTDDGSPTQKELVHPSSYMNPDGAENQPAEGMSI